MRTISSLPDLALSFLNCWHMILFWASVYILFVGLSNKRQMYRFFQNTFGILTCLINYTLFQCTVGYTSQNAETEVMIQVVEQYAKLPAIGLFAVCGILTATEIYIILSMNHWYNTHITSASIKETIETLPVGVCAFESSGKVILRNKTMEQLCRNLMEMPLLNGNEFVKMLSEKKSNLTDFAVSLPDYSVWSFTKDEICNEKICFTLLIAYNVTDEYQKTLTLSEKQKTLRELNKKLVNYSTSIESVITAQEILNAKVHIHDELGTVLLAIKRYLVSGGTEKERGDLLEQLKGNIQFLQQELINDKQNEYSLVLSTAEDLGISVKISGTLPQAEPNKHIIATAIHECFTNIIRHTDADTLYVNISEDKHVLTANFTDNNSKIISGISETGGLCSLRELTEQANGEMHITAEPHYSLTITLPKETDNNEI